MAKELKMKVISEGVETISQVEFLKQIGCDMVQGYLFSKPMPVKSLKKSLFKRIKQCVNNDIYNKGALILVEYTILEHLYFLY